MEETHKLFETAASPAADPDATIVNEHDPTLATPRFDAGEAQEARPVVPLADSPLSRARRSRWPVALVLVSALAGGAISIFAFRVYQQRQSAASRMTTGQPAATQTAEQQEPQQQQQQQQQSPAPIAASPAPSPVLTTTAAAVVVDATEAKPSASSVVETDATEKARAPKKDESAARKVAATEDAKTTRRDERKVEEKRADHVGSGDTRPRLVETIREPRRADEDMRRYDRADDSADTLRREERQERRRARREERRGDGSGDGGRRRNIDRIKDIFEGTPPPA